MKTWVITFKYLTRPIFEVLESVPLKVHSQLDTTACARGKVYFVVSDLWTFHTFGIFKKNDGCLQGKVRKPTSAGDKCQSEKAAPQHVGGSL